MYTRPATIEDADKIARIASRASGPIGNGLWAKAIYPDMTPEQHLVFMRDRVQTWFDNPEYVIHVAVGEPEKDGRGHLTLYPEHSFTAYMARKAEAAEKEEAKNRPPEEGELIIGVIAWIRRDVNNLGPPPRVPPLRPEAESAADEVALQGYLQQSREWKEDALKVYGTYYHGSHLSVTQAYQKHGIGSVLCRLLLAEMKKELKPFPLLMETDYYTMPFYDRFAQSHGLQTSIFGRPYKIPTKRMELFMYFIKIEKAVVRSLPDEIEERKNAPGNTIRR